MILFVKKIKSAFKNLLSKIKINFYWIQYRFFLKKPKILNPLDTIKYIVHNKVSVSRFGDGEYCLMNGGNIGFQDYCQDIENRLTETFMTNNKSLLICICSYQDYPKLDKGFKRWRKSMIYHTYKKNKSYFNVNYVYGEASITRFYEPELSRFYDYNYLDNVYIPLLKKIWERRNVIIVEGEKTLLGVSNDLFENANTIRRIECPNKNAFFKIDSIEKSIIKNYQNDDLILLALGPTATIIAKDLTLSHHYQCIDIGHLDIVYFWYKARSNKKVKIANKYTNECKDDSQIIQIRVNDNYKQEIIDII